MHHHISCSDIDMARSAASLKQYRGNAEEKKNGAMPSRRQSCVGDCVHLAGRPELVQLLVSTHHDVDSFATKHDAVLKRVELGGCRDEGWILAFNPDFLFDADVLASEFECSIRFVVTGCSRAAKSHCQTVANAEACEGLLLGLLGFEGAHFEDKGSVEHKKVEGNIRR